MAEYTYPGVYIEEKPGGPGPISGVSTSNFGLIGSAPKGPVNTVGLFTSFPELGRKHGSFNSDGIAITEGYAFFANGGARLYFVRVVHDDAVASYWDLNFGMTEDENVDNTAEPTGSYQLQLDSMPVVPSSLRLTFGNAGATTDINVFDDDGDGNMVFQASPISGAAAAGGSGTIDYETGEVIINLINPADFTGSTDWITALYDYRVLRFQVKWPGAMGDFYRVRIQPGSDDFLTAATASWSRFTVLLEENVNADASNPAWTVVETYADTVFLDPTDPNYVVTVINDDFTGSDNLEVIDYGNAMNPIVLQGAEVTTEDFSATQEYSDDSGTPPMPYNGKQKGWKYALTNDVFETTFLASFQFEEESVYDSGTDSVSVAAAFLTDTTKDWTVDALVGAVLLNTTDGSMTIVTANTDTTITGVLVGGTLNTWASGDAYEIRSPNQIGIGTTPASDTVAITSPGTAANPAAVTAGSVVIRVVDSTNGLQSVVDVAGTLMHPDAGPAVQVGTIDYDTGQITSFPGAIADELDFSALTGAPLLEAGFPVHMECVYTNPVKVEDDGDGNLSIQDQTALATPVTGVPSKFQLNSNGTNEVDYTDGSFELTWQITGNPAGGPGGAAVETADYYTNPDAYILGAMASGSDGSAVDSGDIVDPALAIDQEGLYAFGQVDEMMQLVAADFQTDTYVSDALITYSELMKDKFTLLTVPLGLTPLEAVNWKKYQLNKFTSYAALYYPHIKIMDPVTDSAADVPCGGHLAGIIARTDITENVSTAAAGVENGRINWSIGLERDLTPQQVGLCNENKINCLVQWPHTGRCVWGARSLDIAGGEWTYTQMRRLFMYVEKSVFKATHIHVFKNNGPPLWSKIRTQVSNFLLGLYQQGYFAGSTPGDAFFVICDRSNNPQNTVDQGLVFCDVGLAPTKPAEFIVFRFQQKSLTS